MRWREVGWNADLMYLSEETSRLLDNEIGDGEVWGR